MNGTSMQRFCSRLAPDGALREAEPEAAQAAKRLKTWLADN